MGKLRHVDITGAVFDFETDKYGIFEGPSKLENLRILRMVSFPSDKANEVDGLLQRCPNLQELDIFFGYEEYSPLTSVELEGLTQLQSLRLTFDSPLCPSKFFFPSNLKKLEIEATDIPRVVSIIARLPSLEYLRLWQTPPSEDEQLTIVSCLGDITFHNLKFLKLKQLLISRWDASEESFPQLETLVIKECNMLEEIPLKFADIPTLKQIKLIACMNKSLEASAERIKKEVEAIEGCDRIDVTIQNISGGKIRQL